MSFCQVIAWNGEMIRDLMLKSVEHRFGSTAVPLPRPGSDLGDWRAVTPYVRERLPHP